MSCWRGFSCWFFPVAVQSIVKSFGRRGIIFFTLIHFAHVKAFFVHQVHVDFMHGPANYRYRDPEHKSFLSRKGDKIFKGDHTLTTVCMFRIDIPTHFVPSFLIKHWLDTVQRHKSRDGNLGRAGRVWERPAILWSRFIMQWNRYSIAAWK